MKNICNIFLRDVKRLKRNVIAIIVLLGICILPSLYAWFNIAAIWNPYDNTDKIPVAVVNQDQGTSLKGIKVNVGDKLVKNLKSNDKMQWNFVSHREAINGIKEGKYYAIVELPSNFSLSMVSFATGEIKRPYIDYYVNKKKNGIAPKITNAAIKSIQNQVNSTFVGTVATYITDTIKVGSENIKITKEDLISSLNKSIDNGVNSLDNLQNTMTSFQNNLKTLQKLLDSTSSLTVTVSSQLDDLENVTAYNLKEIQKIHNVIDPKVMESFPNLDTQFLNVESKISTVLYTVKSANKNTRNSTDVFNNLSSVMSSSIESLEFTAKNIEASKNKLKNLKNETQNLNISKTFINTLNMVIENPEEVGNFLSSPVKVKSHNVYQVDNYGSAMSPFYTTLAIWVGCIIMVAIMKTRVDEDEKIKNITLRQAYLGRFPMFLLIGLIQSLIIALGDLFFLQVQSTNPIIFILTCLFISFVFTLIIYTLTVSFGNIGKALAVIWLVIQVAGSGGTFPIEVLPNSYRFLSNFMPFTFAIDAMRETTAGIYMPNYLIDMIKLSTFIPLSLVLGLVLRNPLYRLNEFFEERLEATKFMG